MFNRFKIKYLSWLERILIIITVIAITAAIVWAADRKVNNNIVQDNANNNGCPADMAYVSAAGGGFCIDKYEASAGKDCPNDNPAAQNDTITNLDNFSCQPESKAGSIPWRNISRDQADLACARAGKRLPTNSEWFRGALGAEDINYGWSGGDCQVNSNWQTQPGLTGSTGKCVSPTGAYDMIGNVWEWVSGTVQDGYFEGKKLPESGYVNSTDGLGFPVETNSEIPNTKYFNDYFWIKDMGVRGIARGGYWKNAADAGQYSMYIVIPPSQGEVGVGFRCAK